MRVILGFIFISILSGCAAISNEGKVDFRRTDTTHVVTGTIYQEFEVKNLSLGNDAVFKKGDSLSLHLRTAFIKDFSENQVTPYVTKAFTRQWGTPQGEIAIVANAFEEKNGKELSFENMREGRVVFYSDDVHEGQVFNFDNMPIYGPIIYEGAPFVFRIAIFELDVISQQAKAMLNTVAQAGSTAYPPASPVLEILNGIGSTFFDGDQTDTEFRYTMVLDHKGGSESINHLKLEVGNYILIRVEDRTKYVPWGELVLNENEGIVYLKKDNGTYEKYIDNTYLVVEINKNISDVSIDLAESNFSTLMSTLKEQDKKNASNYVATHNAIMNVAIQRSQINNFSRAKEILGNLNKPDSEVTKLAKRNQTVELFKMIAKSIDYKGNVLKIDSSKQNESYFLSGQQIKYVTEGLTQLVSGKVNSTNWNRLSLVNIYNGFRGILDPATNTRSIDTTIQTQILDLVAPI